MFSALALLMSEKLIEIWELQFSNEFMLQCTAHNNTKE
jgi:hypothetical protein